MILLSNSNWWITTISASSFVMLIASVTGAAVMQWLKQLDKGDLNNTDPPRHTHPALSNLAETLLFILSVFPLDICQSLTPTMRLLLGCFSWFSASRSDAAACVHVKLQLVEPSVSVLWNVRAAGETPAWKKNPTKKNTHILDLYVKSTNGETTWK